MVVKLNIKRGCVWAELWDPGPAPCRPPPAPSSVLFGAGGGGIRCPSALTSPRGIFQMWKASAGHSISVSQDDGGADDWETDPDFVNDVSEKEQRWGAKTVQGSGHQEHIK
ncbi:src substrate protein p85-like [Gracilinanus agilis]|uniref:src substrate protein p85-like n=1 Tax=Gracilinanus agilis TaxID=191870 RepID=UPI001CFF4370|nr:src substrate protein p85-like [Gracilinanus agilis]